MNPFKLNKRWNLTFQRGWDGKKYEISLSQFTGWAIICLLILLVFLSLTFVFSVKNYEQNKAILQKVQTENMLLRQKLDYYSSIIDSIYQKLDTLQTHIQIGKSMSRYFAYSDNISKTPLQDDTFIYDSYLDARVNSIEQKAGKIAEFLQFDTKQQDPILVLTEDEIARIDIGPSIYPSFGRLADGWGIRLHPFYHKFMFHYGIDIANKVGTPVYATADGEVIESSYDSELGRFVKIRHDNQYETRYGHLYNAQVIPGDKVKKGQIIAMMGNTGMSTGPHLHYEVLYDGKKVNPVYFLNRVDDAVYLAKK